MSVQYQAVGWNRQKRIYDSVLAGGILTYLAIFVGLGAILYPTATAETLLIRGFGTLALVLLHVILCIGPLCRLDRRFLPLLYNRRHLGVAMFLVALVHGVFSIIQFHALGDVSPLVSLFVSNTRYDSLAQFPFQVLGFAALLILFVMAATSHDFWLHNLSAPAWKRIHMLVYLAYALLVAHVVLGALQSDRNLVLAVLLGFGFLLVTALHLLAAAKESRIDRDVAKAAADGFVEVCAVETFRKSARKSCHLANRAGRGLSLRRQDLGDFQCLPAPERSARRRANHRRLRDMPLARLPILAGHGSFAPAFYGQGADISDQSDRGQGAGSSVRTPAGDAAGTVAD